MTEPKYEEFLWIKTSGDIGSGFMRFQFGMSRDDPMPFILTVMPSYVAHKTQNRLLKNYFRGQPCAILIRETTTSRTIDSSGGRFRFDCCSR